MAFEFSFDYIKSYIYSGLFKEEGLLASLKVLLGFSKPLAKHHMLEFFVLGLVAALWIWFVYFVIRMFRYMSYENMSKNEDRTFNYSVRWLNLVAGRLWKVLFFAIGFTVLMYIPIINRIVQILFLGPIEFHWFWRSLIIALEVGYLPFLFEYFSFRFLEAKYERKVTKLGKLSKNVNES